MKPEVGKFILIKAWGGIPSREPREISKVTDKQVRAFYMVKSFWNPDDPPRKSESRINKTDILSIHNTREEAIKAYSWAITIEQEMRAKIEPLHAKIKAIREIARDEMLSCFNPPDLT